MKIKLIGSGVIVLFLILGLWSSSRANEGQIDGQISICITQDGKVYIAHVGCVSRLDNLLTWNIAGPQGEQGTQGIPGPQGPAGTISSTFVVTNSVTGGSQDSVNASASCPTGKILLSGGAKVTNIVSASRAFITASFPSSSSTWTGSASAVDAGAGSLTLTTYALCSE